MDDPGNSQVQERSTRTNEKVYSSVSLERAAKTSPADNFTRVFIVHVKEIMM